MKISALVLLFALATTGCGHYRAKRISMPHTEESAACAAEAVADYEQCVIHQRGRRYCEKLRDTLFLRNRSGGRDADQLRASERSVPALARLASRRRA